MVPDANLPQSTSFSLGFQQGQDVALAHWSLNVADDLTVLLSDEFNLHLCALALGAGTAEHLHDASQNVGFVHFRGVIFGAITKIHVYASESERRKKNG